MTMKTHLPTWFGIKLCNAMMFIPVTFGLCISNHPIALANTSHATQTRHLASITVDAPLDHTQTSMALLTSLLDQSSFNAKHPLTDRTIGKTIGVDTRE